ncbi:MULTISPECIES: hypothetical protein [Bacillaceae]|uniref:hypothetical protein n=1 Tax=Bacillaceae TaxID=186817 RepID=UPI002A11FFE0|nr:hypothetical protein [Cytobacillus sp. IB215316]MDX8362527.1 hypothetical protein [Cytobacillus sp. IB215316]
MAIKLDDSWKEECIHVCKVYDWTTLLTKLTDRELQLTTSNSPIDLSMATIDKTMCDVSLIACEEPDPDDRTEVLCYHDGREIRLWKVSLKKTFCIDITVEATGTNASGMTETVWVTFDTVMVSTCEEVLLCAPPGTEVCCDPFELEGHKTCKVEPIMNISCTQNADGTFTCSATTWVCLKSCQNIMVKFDVVLKVWAQFCEPRGEIKCDLDCIPPANPPQCDELFPLC